MEIPRNETLKVALDKNDKSGRKENAEDIKREEERVVEKLVDFIQGSKDADKETLALRKESLLEAIDNVVDHYNKQPGLETLTRYDVLSWIDPKFSEQVEQEDVLKARTKILVNAWKKGQMENPDGSLHEEKTVCSYNTNVKGLERDLRLLSDSPDIPERDDVKKFMRQRLELVGYVRNELGVIPDGKALFYLISSGNTNEHEPVVAAISDEPVDKNNQQGDTYFTKFVKDLEKAPLCSKGANASGRHPKGAKFHVFVDKGYGDGNDRIYIHLLDPEGHGLPGRFEIGHLKKNEKGNDVKGQGAIMDSAKYFEGEKFRKFDEKDASGAVIKPAGQLISEQANRWINDNRQNLPKFDALLRDFHDVALEESKKPAGVRKIDPWNIRDYEGLLKAIIFIIKTGKTTYTVNRLLKPGEFMTNPEDALTMIKDTKFNDDFRKRLVTILELMGNRGADEGVKRSLSYFLNDEPYTSPS